MIIDLFGISPVALRFAAALVMTTGIWLTGMMARALGGGRRSQALAMLAAAVAPLPITNMRFFSYQTFDYLWWVLTAYLIIRLVQTNDPRWWLAIGAVLGLGMMTKYSIFSQKEVESAFLDCSLAGHTPNPYGIENEETRNHPDIFVCRNLRYPWPDFWKEFRIFG